MSVLEEAKKYWKKASIEDRMSFLKEEVERSRQGDADSLKIVDWAFDEIRDDPPADIQRMLQVRDLGVPVVQERTDKVDWLDANLLSTFAKDPDTALKVVREKYGLKALPYGNQIVILDEQNGVAKVLNKKGLSSEDILSAGWQVYRGAKEFGGGIGGGLAGLFASGGNPLAGAVGGVVGAGLAGAQGKFEQDYIGQLLGYPQKPDLKSMGEEGLYAGGAQLLFGGAVPKNILKSVAPNIADGGAAKGFVTPDDFAEYMDTGMRSPVTQAPDKIVSMMSGKPTDVIRMERRVLPEFRRREALPETTYSQDQELVFYFSKLLSKAEENVSKSFSDALSAKGVAEIDVTDARAPFEAVLAELKENARYSDVAKERYENLLGMYKSIFGKTEKSQSVTMYPGKTHSEEVIDPGSAKYVTLPGDERVVDRGRTYYTNIDKGEPVADPGKSYYRGGEPGKRAYTMYPEEVYNDGKPSKGVTLYPEQVYEEGLPSKGATFYPEKVYQEGVTEKPKTYYDTQEKYNPIVTLSPQQAHDLKLIIRDTVLDFRPGKIVNHEGKPVDTSRFAGAALDAIDALDKGIDKSMKDAGLIGYAPLQRQYESVKTIKRNLIKHGGTPEKLSKFFGGMFTGDKTKYKLAKEADELAGTNLVGEGEQAYMQSQYGKKKPGDHPLIESPSAKAHISKTPLTTIGGALGTTVGGLLGYGLSTIGVPAQMAIGGGMLAGGALGTAAGLAASRPSVVKGYLNMSSIPGSVWGGAERRFPQATRNINEAAQSYGLPGHILTRPGSPQSVENGPDAAEQIKAMQNEELRRLILGGQ